MFSMISVVIYAGIMLKLGLIESYYCKQNMIMSIVGLIVMLGLVQCTYPTIGHEWWSTVALIVGAPSFVGGVVVVLIVGLDYTKVKP